MWSTGGRGSWQGQRGRSSSGRDQYREGGQRPLRETGLKVGTVLVPSTNRDAVFTQVKATLYQATPTKLRLSLLDTIPQNLPKDPPALPSHPDHGGPGTTRIPRDFAPLDSSGRNHVINHVFASFSRPTHAALAAEKSIARLEMRFGRILFDAVKLGDLEGEVIAANRIPDFLGHAAGRNTRWEFNTNIEGIGGWSVNSIGKSLKEKLGEDRVAITSETRYTIEHTSGKRYSCLLDPSTQTLCQVSEATATRDQVLRLDIALLGCNADLRLAIDSGPAATNETAPTVTSLPSLHLESDGNISHDAESLHLVRRKEMTRFVLENFGGVEVTLTNVTQWSRETGRLEEKRTVEIEFTAKEPPTTDWTAMSFVRQLQSSWEAAMVLANGPFSAGAGDRAPLPEISSAGEENELVDQLGRLEFPLGSNLNCIIPLNVREVVPSGYIYIRDIMLRRQ